MSHATPVPTPIPEHHHEDALDHLEEEIKNLEGVTRFGRPLRIGAFVIVTVAAVAGAIWWVSSPPPITSSRASYVTTTGSPIEVVEPRGNLAYPPARFAWESVTGRLQYVIRVYVKGENTPIVERMVTSSFVELTPGEQARIPRGKTFVWTVVAQGIDGSTIGAGQQTFKVR
jgi:hypothetical protein